MNKALAIVAILLSGAALSPQSVDARGYGGARGGESRGGAEYRGGGSYSGSHEGSYSGNHYSGSHEGSVSNGTYSGSRQGSYHGANYSGSHESSAGGGTFSGSREGSYNGANYKGAHEAAYGGSREGGAAYGARGVGAAGFEGGAHAVLPTDGGFAAAGAATGARLGNAHMTEPFNGNVAAARGASVRGSFNNPGMFGQGWYGAHPNAWQAAGGLAGGAWASASWPAIGSTFGWGAGVQPIAYNYGNNITYQGNQVYNGDQPIATADDYYQQAANLAQSVPAPDADSTGWTPLGTFGLVRSEESDPHYVMQLAVNKSGAVAGNYCDMQTDNNLPIYGSVDPQTQKLAWTVGNNKRVVGEVGLYNLTQNEAPALLHIGKEKTQQWLLVKLKQPAPADGQ